MNRHLWSFSCRLQCGCFLLTFVIMPHTDLGQFAQAEQVRKSNYVFVFTLKLVPVGAGLQRQRASIPVLSEQNQKDVGISACTCVYQGKQKWTLNYSEREFYLLCAISSVLTCHITGLDLDDVGCILHHLLVFYHGWKLTHCRPLRPACLRQPVLICKHVHLICGQIPHQHLKTVIQTFIADLRSGFFFIGFTITGNERKRVGLDKIWVDVMNCWSSSA